MASASAPSSALPSVDLPAPDGPTSTTVPDRTARTASTPSPVAALQATTSTPGAAAATSARSPAAPGTRSALVSTTTGRAPLSQASASSRSIRPRSSGTASDTATATVSTLAARTWPRESRDADDRTIAVRRGSSAATAGRPSGPPARSAAQSPVHGAAAGSPPDPVDRPDPVEARAGPFSVTTSHRLRSTAATRAGISPAAR